MTSEPDNVVKFYSTEAPVEQKLDKDAIEELRRKKLLRDHQENISLDPVGPGEKHIGYLTNEERVVYTEMAVLRGELDDRTKELQARTLEMFAASIRKSGKPEDVQGNIDEKIIFPTDEEAEDFFLQETRFEYLRAIYNNSIRERYGHAAFYGVRSDFAVVRVGYKYKSTDNTYAHQGT